MLTAKVTLVNKHHQVFEGIEEGGSCESNFSSRRTWYSAMCFTLFSL